MKNKEDCSSKPDFLRVPFRARCLSAKQHTESNVMNEFDSKLMSSKKKKDISTIASIQKAVP